jgi:dehydrogenase/reductase SDR family member 7B
MRFFGKVVWITGASSGIGEALAHAFAHEGARLVLSSRRTDELERVRRSCEGSDQHVVQPLDLSRTETFHDAMGTVIERCGGVDILINNAGIGQRALAGDCTLEVERAIMEVNYFGPVALTKVVLPSMRARRSGHVVVVSSVMGYLGLPGRSTYAAAKHALHGYFDSLRAEVWRERIQVTLVCPGFVKTALSQNALGARGEKYGRMDRGQKRGITPRQCAVATVKAVARGRSEIYVGGSEVAGVYLMRFMPWLYRLIAKRVRFSGAER